MSKQLLVFDFFAGTGSATKAFEDRGHKVIKVEIDPYFDAEERDIKTLSADFLLGKYGKPDFIWASPPCTTFSVSSIKHYWVYENKIAKPKNDKSREGLFLVSQTLKLISEINPKIGWLMENPRGMLRKQDVVKNLNRRTITYCQYGKRNQKPTDLWGNLNGWIPRPICKPGDSCHDSAKRGSNAGTQRGGGRGKQDRINRSMIPYELSLEICKVVEDAQQE